VRRPNAPFVAITILAVLWGFSTSAYSTTYVTVAPADDLRAIIESAADDTVITLTAGTFNLGVNAPYNQGIIIQNKTDLTITGQGWDSTIIKLPSNANFGFYTGSNVHNLKIEKMHIEGTTPLSTNTHGIGNYSGSTNVTDVTLSELRLKDTAVGISLGTSESGVLTGVAITNNVISNTIGLDSGWGYGIHTENGTNVLIADNLIQNATRHSIYLSRSASGSNVTIERNTILNHDPAGQQRAITGRWYVAALAVTRASDVNVVFNEIVNSRTIALSVEPDDILGWPSSDINLVGNEITDAWYVGLWVITNQTHTAMGNTITHFPNPDADGNGWNAEISFIDYPRGVITSSALEPPDPRWAAIDYIDEMGDGNVYVMKDGVLDKITDPYETWAYDTCPTSWPLAESMTAVADAAGAGQGRLYIFESDILYEVNPDNWQGAVITLGDANADGLVDSADLALWQQNYDPLGENKNIFSMGDWNLDGLIDSADLALWQQNYDPIGPGGLGAAHAPEPATLFLLAIGGLVVLMRRRKE